MFKRLRVRFIALSMASLLLVLGVILGAANYLSYRHVVQNADEILDILAANGGTFPKPEGFGNEDNNVAPVFPMEPGQPGVWSEGETQPEPPSEAEAQPSAGTINPQPGILQPNPPTDGETLPWETPEVVWQSVPDEDDLSNVLRQLDAEEEDDADDDDSEETAIRDRNAVRRQEMPYESRFFTVTVNDAGDVLSVDTGKIAAVDMADAVEYAQEALESGKERGFIDDYSSKSFWRFAASLPCSPAKRAE